MTPRQKWTAFTTIVLKEARRIVRLWIQTILPPVITTILYFVIFGHIIGARVGAMAGVSYIQFIAPGLIVMPMIINAFASGSASFYSAKMMRQIEELLISPMSPLIMLLGFMVGGMFRGLLVGLCVGITTLFFTHLHVENLFVILFTALLSCAFFSLFGILNGVYAKSFDDIALIPNFVITPLIYLGGVFYSVNLLSPFWQHLSLLNPLFYIVDCFRYGFLSINHSEVLPAMLALLVLFIALFVAVLSLMKKGYRLRG